MNDFTKARMEILWATGWQLAAVPREAFLG